MKRLFLLLYRLVVAKSIEKRSVTENGYYFYIPADRGCFDQLPYWNGDLYEFYLVEPYWLSCHYGALTLSNLILSWILMVVLIPRLNSPEMMCDHAQLRSLCLLSCGDCEPSEEKNSQENLQEIVTLFQSFFNSWPGSKLMTLGFLHDIGFLVLSSDSF